MRNCSIFIKNNEESDMIPNCRYVKVLPTMHYIQLNEDFNHMDEEDKEYLKTWEQTPKEQISIKMLDDNRSETVVLNNVCLKNILDGRVLEISSSDCFHQFVYNG